MEYANENMERLENLQKLLQNDDTDGFRKEFLEIHPYDQAMFFRLQPKEIRMQIYTYLSPEEVAEIMINIELE